jgi:diguanylate cyclase (GGDEF)-like protein
MHASFEPNGLGQRNGGSASTAGVDSDIDRRRPENIADIDSLIRFIAGELAADAAMLTVHDGQPGEPRIYSAWGLPLGPTILDGVSGRGSIGHALARQKPIARRVGSPNGGNGHRPGVVHGLIAPVKSPGGIRGALTVGFVGEIDERDLALAALGSYASVIGLWLDDSEALVGLLRASFTDGLTGCLTYPALIHRLEDEQRRSARTGQPLSCLFIDLDNFKRVNDSDGHLAGNRALVGVAGAIRARVRATDSVARFGGDEFVVLLPDTGTLHAQQVADSLASAILESSRATGGPQITASIGVAELQAGMRPAELLECADSSLRMRRRTAPRMEADIM